ncbi:MAG: ABC transporter ATP-binding protein [Ignavibacteriales bacterium]|nr:ABC transporter ATP-binding protein [Ignavibacteriales bacterium]
MKTILSVKELTYSVKAISEKKIILDNISFTLEEGKILGIAGESGSGKTTLAKILCGLNIPDSGEIIFNTSTEEIKNHIQILFQNNGELLNPYRKVENILSEALAIGRKKNNQSLELKGLMQIVDIEENLLQRRCYQLSGGQQQRVALARILAVNPKLIILDEPFSAQDPESQLNFLNLFKKINKELGTTLICIAHSLKILRKLADEVIILYKGKIVEQGKTEIVFSSPQHNYTKFLLKAESYDLKYEDILNDLLMIQQIKFL